MGYRLDRIVLMPYGAVVSGDISGITPAQELAVCAAGPLVNAVTALFFVALWWLYPETYPYTDTAAYISLSLALVNLLPAYPLDGGRALRVLLRPLGERRAKIACVALSAAIALAVMGFFVYTCARGEPQWSAAAFSVLLAAGIGGGGRYARVKFSRKKSFERGVEERRVALSADRTVGYALRFLRDDRYLVLVLFDGEEFFGEVTEEELLKGVDSGDWSQSLRNLCL